MSKKTKAKAAKKPGAKPAKKIPAKGKKAVAPKSKSKPKAPVKKAAKPAKTKPAAKAAPAPSKKAAAPVAPPAPVVVAPPPPPPPPAPVAAPSTPADYISRPSKPVKNTQPILPPPVVHDPSLRRAAPDSSASNVKKGSAILYDSHMHTPLCKHAWGEPEEYAEQALKAGLKGIIFTCHCPMPSGFWPTVRMDDMEFDTYVSIVKRASDKYKGRLDVWLGLESEYFPGHEKFIEELHSRADFHFILGSVHWQSKEYLAKYETGTIEGFRRTYFTHLADSAESKLYDCLGHPDLVKNYHPDSWCFAIVKDHAAKCLDRIAATGVAMEINTSGLNKSYSEMNPGNEFLGMMAERGIPVVIGSDAHRPVRVGDQFIRALDNLKAAGYKEISHFEWRQRKTTKIDDALASLRKHALATK